MQPQPSLIDYWSYSSMSSFLSNPLAFKKKYVLKIYDDIKSPSSVVGGAGHKALEMYFKGGMDVDAAVKAGLDVINNLRQDREPGQAAWNVQPSDQLLL
jgi:hypothetical protein